MPNKIMCFVFAVALAVAFTSVTSRVYAGDDAPAAGSDYTAQPESAGQQLEDAAQDGQEAVEAPTDEGAKAESNETFDTPHDADGD